MKKGLLFVAAACMAASAIGQVAPGEYYICNVETGQFLNAGFRWGTQGVLKEEGRLFTVTQQGEGYVISSTMGKLKVDGTELYVDGGDDVVATLTASGDSYTIEIGGKFLTVGDKELFPKDERPQTFDDEVYNVTYADAADGAKTEWRFMTHEDMVDGLAAATAEKPVNATFFLKAHAFDYNDPENETAWNYEGEGKTIVWCGWQDQMNEWFNRGIYLMGLNDEKDGEIVVSQEAEGMPAGVYKATLYAVNQENTPLVINLNDTKASAYAHTDSDLWYASAANEMCENPQEATFTVGDDGKLMVKMVKTCKADGQNRFAFKKIKLNYLGKDASGAVCKVAADVDGDAEVVYYNLNGVRVVNPENGIFIAKRGNAVSKVVM